MNALRKSFILFKTHLSQSGFSLTELMVASGIAVTLSLILSYSLPLFHSPQSINLYSEWAQLIHQIRAAYSDPAICTATFGGSLYSPPISYSSLYFFTPDHSTALTLLSITPSNTIPFQATSITLQQAPSNVTQTVQTNNGTRLLDTAYFTIQAQKVNPGTLPGPVPPLAAYTSGANFTDPNTIVLQLYRDTSNGSIKECNGVNLNNPTQANGAFGAALNPYQVLASQQSCTTNQGGLIMQDQSGIYLCNYTTWSLIPNYNLNYQITQASQPKPQLGNPCSLEGAAVYDSTGLYLCTSQQWTLIPSQTTGTVLGPPGVSPQIGSTCTPEGTKIYNSSGLYECVNGIWVHYPSVSPCATIPGSTTAQDSNNVPFCWVSAPSCPSNSKPYPNWTSTRSNTCVQQSTCNQQCDSGSHVRQNMQVETVSCNVSQLDAANDDCYQVNTIPCEATITEVGCVPN